MAPCPPSGYAYVRAVYITYMSVVSNLWVATALGVALIFSGVAVTRHMLACCFSTS